MPDPDPDPDLVQLAPTYPPTHSRRQPLRCPRVERRKLHTRQVQIPRDDAIETDATTTVGRAARLPEDVDVLLDAGTGGVDALLADARDELVGVVDTLAAREDLLAAHEEVEGVGDFGAVVGQLGVEGPRRLGEPVDDVEVRAELAPHDRPERLLLRRRHVLVVGHVAELLGPFLAQQLLRFREREAHFAPVFWQEEFLAGVDGADDFELGGAALCFVLNVWRLC